MYDFFKNIAEENDWGFQYARKDYLNLSADDVNPNQVQMFLEPITTDSSFSETGRESKTYNGNMLLLMASDVDEDYDAKYQTYIKPLIDVAKTLITDSFSCSDYEIKNLKTIEVINIFDGNLDGLFITYLIALID
ncbi:MAG: hypothetical protein DI539_16065 [Flavobacterium psychrophilum]|nr:MAG: hypothetical protein DI539_16065 [Flavobacterium psychrophilum]